MLMARLTDPEGKAPARPQTELATIATRRGPARATAPDLLCPRRTSPGFGGRGEQRVGVQPGNGGSTASGCLGSAGAADAEEVGCIHGY